MENVKHGVLWCKLVFYSKPAKKCKPLHNFHPNFHFCFYSFHIYLKHY